MSTSLWPYTRNTRVSPELVGCIVSEPWMSFQKQSNRCWNILPFFLSWHSFPPWGAPKSYFFSYLAWQELKKSGLCGHLSRLEGGALVSSCPHAWYIYSAHISAQISYITSVWRKKKDLFIELLKHRDLTPTLIFAFHASEKGAIKH